MPFPIDQPLNSSVLMERAFHLEALTRIVQSLCQGRGQIVLIGGEAGIGKTRLISELRGQLKAATPAPNLCQTLVLQGACFEPDQAVSYAPLTDLIRQYIAEESALDTVTGSPSVARLLPELAAQFPHAMLETEIDKHRLWVDLLTFFDKLSVARPIVLTIEDIHWADESTLEFLAFLARGILVRPILLVLSYRTDEVGSGLGRFLAGLDRTRIATEFNLPHLSKSAVGAMLRAILRLDRPIRTDLLETIYILTEGNPFFVEEVVKSLGHAGTLSTDHDWDRLSPDTLNIPRTVQVAVQQRLDHLSAAAQRLAQLAAVMGRRFDFTLLMLLSGEPENALVTPIRELIIAQIIVEESADTFAFRHALTRQAIYAQLLLRERRTLHKTIAEAIEAYPSLTPGGAARIDDLSYHFYQAERWEKAADYAQQAGEKALKLYAPHTAVLHYTHAIDALRRFDVPSSVLYSKRGEAHEQIGDFEAARTDYEQALKAAQQTNNSTAEWQSLLALGFLWTSRDFAHAGTYFEHAIASARLMNDPKVLATSLNRIGNWCANTERPYEALRYHREALALFEGTGESRELAATLDLLGVTSLLAGDLVSSLHYYHEAVQRWRQIGERLGLSSSLAIMSLAGASVMTDTVYCPSISLEESLQEGQEALGIACDIGWQPGEAGAQMYLGLGLISRGEYARALELGKNALAVATSIEHRLWIAGAHMLLGRLYLDLLALPQALQHLTQALAMGQEIDTRFMINANAAFLARLHIAENQLDIAEQLLDATPIRREGDPYSATQRLMLSARVELALAQGDVTSALGLVDELIATAANLDDQSRIIPRLWHLRGQALIALKRNAEAESVLMSAFQAANVQGVPPQRWRILITLGQYYLAVGKRTEAEKAFAEARFGVEQLANALHDESLAKTLRSGAEALMPVLPAPTPRQAVKGAFDGLTDREREIAVLIAQGKSNREIAEALYLSKRTVDAHIGNILSKLGFSSRTRIARWAVEKGLLTSY